MVVETAFCAPCFSLQAGEFFLPRRPICLQSAEHSFPKPVAGVDASDAVQQTSKTLQLRVVPPSDSLAAQLPCPGSHALHNMHQGTASQYLTTAETYEALCDSCL